MTENKKIHIVIGTKAQLIKMAPIMVELEARKIPYNYIFTGQHNLTMDELRENFNIKAPDITLYKGKDITGVFQSMIWLFSICAKTIFKKKEILGKTDKSHILLTHGDTFSTILGALMGKIARIKVAHVESGLRSFHIFSPFPEEINRLLTFRLSDIYFCPGKWALNNIKKYKGEKIDTNYNTLFDSLQLALKKTDTKIDLPKEDYAVVSLHRFENIFSPTRFEKIIELLIETSKTIKLLFILHEPTRLRLEKTGLIKRIKENKNIELRPRYDYFKFVKLIHNAKFIMTDGGSNQEECFYLGKPCLIMRETTERTEGLGKNALISKFDKEIIKNFSQNYKQFEIDPKKEIDSPTNIIVNRITKN
ncbi:MAG: UDP-N-acetylglucosamine 2-epimerase [Candidatus Gracilibacteria bacterium]|jgi:UDP-N-acetylglucosamine 2-epimerase (non-hydrolysing)|nr:UDP-N-acetylglucosamine 2-epimerase [Candidatus Gracilibacteria bacterium]